MKFKKRSLRSSGAISKPDYYALGLDLMIHRRRKNKSSRKTFVCFLDFLYQFSFVISFALVKRTGLDKRYHFQGKHRINSVYFPLPACPFRVAAAATRV